MSEENANERDDWLTLAEIAKELHLRPVTIRSWVAKGELRAMRSGRRKWLVRRSELDRLLDRQTARGQPGPDEGWVIGEEVPAHVLEEMAASVAADRSDERNVWLASAAVDWDDALEQSAMAPPGPRFSWRIRRIAQAAAARSAWMQEQIEEEPGAGWAPIPRAKGMVLSYELRPGGSRPGPRDAWRHFDRCVGSLGEAMSGDSLVAVQAAFARLAIVMREIADALDNQNPQTRPAAEERGEDGGGQRPMAEGDAP